MTSLPATIGRYEVLDRIGHGGMGSLYLARDPAIERLVAIKILRDDNDEVRERFAREARAAGRLRHANIVTIFDVGDHEGQPFMAMEYIHGNTLAELIRRRVTWPIARKLTLMEELCGGLSYAHKSGVVHRDIKPANLIVDSEGVLKILDFGIARLTNSGMTLAGSLVGTLNYMSPEQVEGRPVDLRSDIFAVGTVIYEWLTYRQAFPGNVDDGIMQRIARAQPTPMSEVMDGIDPAVEAIVVRALEKDPAKRYQELGAMRKEMTTVRARLEVAGAEPTWRHGAPAAPPAVPPTPASTGRRTDRQHIAQRRAERISALILEAEGALEARDFDAAVQHCEDAAMLDPENPRVLDLLDHAKTGQEDLQVEGWLREAQNELDRGAFTAAADLAERALAMKPSSTDAVRVRQQIQEARRDAERKREREAQVAASLELARASLATGALDAALRAATEALAADPECEDAREVRQSALDAIEERRKDEERRAAAQREAEEAARREAEEASRRAAEEAAHREAVEAARRDAEEAARRETEEAARRETDETARLEAEHAAAPPQPERSPSEDELAATVGVDTSQLAKPSAPPADSFAALPLADVEPGTDLPSSAPPPAQTEEPVAPVSEAAHAEAAQLMQVAHRAFQAAAYRVARDTANRVLALVPNHEEAAALRQLAMERYEATRRGGSTAGIASGVTPAVVSRMPRPAVPDPPTPPRAATIPYRAPQQDATALSPPPPSAEHPMGDDTTAMWTDARDAVPPGPSEGAAIIPGNSRQLVVYGGVAAALFLLFVVISWIGSGSDETSVSQQTDGATELQSPSPPSAASPDTDAPTSTPHAGASTAPLPQPAPEPGPMRIPAVPVPQTAQELDEAVRRFVNTARRQLDGGAREEALGTTVAGLQLRRTDRELRSILSSLARDSESRMTAARQAATERSTISRAPSYPSAEAAESEGRRLATNGDTAGSIRRFWTATTLYNSAAREADDSQSTTVEALPREQSPSPAAVPPAPQAPAETGTVPLPAPTPEPAPSAPAPAPTPQVQAQPPAKPQPAPVPLPSSGPVRVQPSEAPALLRRIEPIYPSMAVTARQIGWDGNVTLDVVIRKNGRVGDVKVLSATNRAFERSAVDAVKRWQFAPSDRDVIVTLKVAFKID